MINDTTRSRKWTLGSDEVIVLRHSCRLIGLGPLFVRLGLKGFEKHVQ